MPPFQPNATRAGAGARPRLPPRRRRAPGDGAEHVLARDVQAADVVQAAVVGFADERVHRPHVRVAGCASVQRTTASIAVPTAACWSGRSAIRWCPVPAPAWTRQVCRTRCRQTPRPAPCRETDCRSCGRIAVTPVRTVSPPIIVVCPTRTPATSVMALSGPEPRRRARCRRRAPADGPGWRRGCTRRPRRVPPRSGGGHSCTRFVQSYTNVNPLPT